MAFPKTILSIGIGWSDLGRKSSWHKEGNPYDVKTFSLHMYCKSRTNIGKENGKLFEFCPRCMVKIEN